MIARVTERHFGQYRTVCKHKNAETEVLYKRNSSVNNSHITIPLPSLQNSRSHITADEPSDFKSFRYNHNLGAAVLFILFFAVASTLRTYCHGRGRDVGVDVNRNTYSLLRPTYTQVL